MNFRFAATVAILIVAGLSSTIVGSSIRHDPGLASAAYEIPLSESAEVAAGVDVGRDQKDIGSDAVAEAPAPAESTASLTFRRT